MRISDWSSDVCSSDLAGVLRHRRTSSGKRHAARVLAVSDERLPGVRVPVRDVWRARYPLRRWTRAEGTVRPAADRAQHVDVVAVVDYLRLRDAGDAAQPALCGADLARSEEHTSELQSLMRISYAVFCLKKKNHKKNKHNTNTM